MLGYVLRRIREFKCEHEWERLFAARINHGNYESLVAVYRCKKCGMEKKYVCD